MTLPLEKIMSYQHHLFHGSAVDDLEKLEVNKAVDNADGKDSFNNDTAVFATDNISLAIIYGLIDIEFLPAPKFGGWNARTVEVDGKFVAYPEIPAEWKDNIEQTAGYVYILPRETFAENDGLQWKSFVSVKPIDKIKVTVEDFYKAGGKIEWMS